MFVFCVSVFICVYVCAIKIRLMSTNFPSFYKAVQSESDIYWGSESMRCFRFLYSSVLHTDALQSSRLENPLHDYTVTKNHPLAHISAVISSALYYCVLIYSSSFLELTQGRKLSEWSLSSFYFYSLSCIFSLPLMETFTGEILWGDYDTNHCNCYSAKGNLHLTEVKGIKP